MHMIVHVARRVSDRGESTMALLAAAHDLKDAYRQVLLASSQIAISVIAVYNPIGDKVQFHELYGQSFGAGHVVPNFSIASPPS